MTSPEIIIHATDYPIETPSLRILVEKNIAGKMDTYLAKLTKGGESLRIELAVHREKNDQAGGKLIITAGTRSYRSERENFDNLADLVNHLFTHVKEQLAK